VMRMTRAVQRTLEWIAAHNGRDLAEVVADYLPEIPATALAACCTDYKALGLWNTTPVPQRAGIEWLRDAMLSAGTIRTRFSYEDLVDARFAESVTGKS